MFPMLLPAILGAVGAVGAAVLPSLAGANAQANAAKDSADVQWKMYEDQARRNQPWESAGKNALDFQSQWLGLPSGGSSSGGDTSRLIGSEDQWMSYLQAYPALQKEWSRLTTQGKNPFRTPAEYAQWHYTTYGPNGANEGWQLPSGNTQTNQPVGGTQLAGQSGSGTPDIWDTIKKNPLWTAATEGFLGVDAPEIDARFATGGKAMSGAQKKALYDRSVARSYNALGDIYGQYAGVSGTGFNATQATNSAGQTAASNVGNAFTNKGNAQASGYSAIGSAIGGGISGLTDAWAKYGGAY